MTIRLIFPVISALVLGLGAFGLGRWMLSRSPWARQNRKVVWGGLVSFVIIEMMTFATYSRALFVGRAPLMWLSFLLLGVFACTIVYVAVIEIFVYLTMKAFNQDQMDASRRSFLAVSSLTIGSSGIGVTQASMGPRLYEVDIPLANLPPEFEGFKIAQISDLHVGPTIGRTYTEQVVAMVNACRPQMVALTGDFVDGSVADLSEGVAPLAKLRSEYGSFFVTGNHEYYSGVHEWIAEFRKLGAHVLLNEHSVLEKNGQRLVIAGVTDYKSSSMEPLHVSDPVRALQGAPRDAVKILLAHQPNSYKEAHKAGYDVQLSGHTHGGQFFPWSVAVQLAHRYYKGLNRHDQMWVYVNRGTGYWGPPMRFMVPAEVTVLTLRKA